MLALISEHSTRRYVTSPEMTSSLLRTDRSRRKDAGRQHDWDAPGAPKSLASRGGDATMAPIVTHGRHVPRLTIISAIGNRSMLVDSEIRPTLKAPIPFACRRTDNDIVQCLDRSTRQIPCSKPIRSPTLCRVAILRSSGSRSMPRPKRTLDGRPSRQPTALRPSRYSAQKRHSDETACGTGAIVNDYTAALSKATRRTSQ
jgi:hypothetical protein